jgi:hypothetical protein
MPDDHLPNTTPARPGGADPSVAAVAPPWSGRRGPARRTLRPPRAAAAAAAALGCAVVALGSAGAAPAQAQPARLGVQDGGGECAGLRGGRPLTYRNARYGFTMTYPSVFALDPASVPEDGDSARFWTADRRATVVVNGLRNGMGQSLAELRREARQDIAENSRGTITYERATADWFVLSGYVGGRIFYRRTFLSHGGRVIATLWIEFPPQLRPCLDGAVTMMSLSFRQGGGP